MNKENLFSENGQPIHFDANDGKLRIHRITFPIPRKRCECWRDFGHVSEYYSGIMEETHPELTGLSDEELDGIVRRMRRKDFDMP